MNSDRDQWATIAVPEGLRAVFSECMWLAERLNEFTSNKAGSDTVARLDAFELILGNFLTDAQAEYFDFVENLEENESAYRLACYDALVRDNFRCTLCDRSSVNRGSLDPHHIIPRSHKAYANLVVGDINSVDNIAILDRKCHDEIQPVWREYAPTLFERIGCPDLAERMKETREP